MFDSVASLAPPPTAWLTAGAAYVASGEFRHPKCCVLYNMN